MPLRKAVAAVVVQRKAVDVAVALQVEDVEEAPPEEGVAEGRRAAGVEHDHNLLLQVSPPNPKISFSLFSI